MDKEKIIKDLEFCVNGHFKVELSLATKILALLKEQEAVEPKINEYGQAFCECGENVGIIPNSEQLPSVRMKKICPECGRLLKWAGKQ